MPIRSGRVVLTVAVAGLILAQREIGAQNLAFSLFERYLEPLRVQAAIPGLSVAIVQNRQIVWERGLGYRDLEAFQPAMPDTPYPIADLTSTMTAALMGRCIDQGQLDLDVPIGTWAPASDEPGLTLRQVVKHAAPGTLTGFKYNPTRFALLARPVEDCLDVAFRKAIARELFDRFTLRDSVPGYDIASVPQELRSLFDDATLARYASVLSRMAAPYKLNRSGKPTRSELPPAVVDGSHGVVSSVRDLASFDAALDSYAILSPTLLAEAWTTSSHNGVATPFGMGWFVQTYQGEKLVWQFGHAPDAYSSLILKVPNRHLTLILLANSDGLSAPYSLTDGDVTSSLFARTFLRLFL
jgi:CubicO group peptidase (beta-lactamase class C family)